MSRESPDVTATFTGSVTDEGKLLLDEPAIVLARLFRMFKGHRVDVVVSRQKRQRSDAQNRLLWSYYKFIAEWSGHEPEEIHEALKLLLLPREIELPSGTLIPAVTSTRGLDVAAFSEYVERVRRWAAEQGVYLPSPNEPWEAVING